MTLVLFSLLLNFVVALSCFAQERGAPIFSDEFSTSATFAERWVPNNQNVKSVDGGVVFPRGGSLTMRGETPLEFYAEINIMVDMSHQPDKTKWNQAFCGFRIEGLVSWFCLPETRG